MEMNMDYVAPEVEVVMVEVEKGFLASGDPDTDVPGGGVDPF